jgi:ABC-type sugar transport system permease subunit
VAKGRWRENTVTEKLTIWFVFSVIVTLAPFFLGFLQSVDRNQKFTFSSILGNGQLLLVSVAISAAALGELVLVEVLPLQRIMKTLAIGSCTLVVIIASLWFGDVSAAVQSKVPPDPRTISTGSVIVYVWALGSSIWCLTLAARKAGPPSVGKQVELLRGMQQDKEK